MSARCVQHLRSRAWVAIVCIASSALASERLRAGEGAAAVVATRAGLVQGATRAGVEVYLGVPFAHPPVGPLRWRAPQPLEIWRGVRAASEFGPSCMQDWPPPRFGPYTDEFLATPKPAEDCLYLNVWRPVPRRKSLPVFVWIHGGGFLGGSGAVPIYDGRHLAARGIVVVTINYRVGLFGFLAHPELTRESADTAEGAGNYGTLDAIAALRWVRENIAAFGGDPARVTIAGQSAGAALVNALIVSPHAKGLFARAIAQSGAGLGIPSTPLAEAEQRGLELARRVGAADLGALRALPAQTLQDANPLPFGAPPGAPRPIPFRPVLDHVVLPVDPIDGGAPVASNVPVMTGYTADDFVPAGKIDRSAFEASVRARFGAHAERILALYAHSTDTQASASAGRLARDIYSTSLLLWAQRRSAQGGRVFAYLYEHSSPVADGPSFGTFHSSEIPYLFGHLDRQWRPYSALDDQIAALLQDRWLAFVRRGEPNSRELMRWAPFTPRDVVVMGLGDRVGPRLPVSTPERFAALEAFVRDGGRLSIN